MNHNEGRSYMELGDPDTDDPGNPPERPDPGKREDDAYDLWQERNDIVEVIHE